MKKQHRIAQFHKNRWDIPHFSIIFQHFFHVIQIFLLQVFLSLPAYFQEFLSVATKKYFTFLFLCCIIGR